MKLSALVCCVLLVMVLPVHAQEDSVQHMQPEIIAFGGTAIPYLPLEFRNFWKSGSNFGAGFGYSFEPGSVGYGAVSATVEYSQFAFNPTAYTDSMLAPYDPNNLPPQAAYLKSHTLSSAKASALNASVNFKGSFSKISSAFAPYFLIGVGYMYYSVEDVAVDTLKDFRIDGKKSGCFSWSAGVGVEVPVTEKIAGFVQIRSQLGIVDKTRQFFPLDAGIRIRF
jgi:opacity protein-like surface antigen